jgi:hypothetical protein
MIPEKSAAIAAKLAARFPGIDTMPAFAWAGGFGSTASGLPVIRRVPRRPRLHAVLGHGGDGINSAGSPRRSSPRTSAAALLTRTCSRVSACGGAGGAPSRSP